VLYRKQQKRFKTAEAFEKEVTALKTTVEILQQQVAFQEGRINETQKLVINKDAYIAQLSQEKHAIEIKHAKNKSAINKAYGCGHCSDASLCPVLKQRTENEEEYLKTLNNQNYNRNEKD
jgi:TPP-dependent indolepyruvate ferredoxin oxidoreductase alpha subunit